MYPPISKEVIQEVRKLLPEVREEVLKEFTYWSKYYHAGEKFHSDDEVIQALPCATYEYILLTWNIEPTRISMPSVVNALNDKLFTNLRLITAHALRRLAMHTRTADKI